MDDASPTAGYPAQHPTERELERWLPALLSGCEPYLKVEADAGDPRVRGAFLRWFLLSALGPGAPISRFALWNATICGPLTLTGMKLERTVGFMTCTFDAPIELVDAQVVGFEVIGGTLKALHADRLSASGSLLVRNAVEDSTYIHPQPFGARVEVESEILLSGAKIRGNVDLRGCRIGHAPRRGYRGACVLADGASVASNVLLNGGADCLGEVRLNGIDIARNFYASGSTFGNRGGFSISMAGAHVRGSVYLNRDATPFHSTGSLRLEGATIDGDLDATGGIFMSTAHATPGWTTRDDSNATDAIAADGMKVGAELRFRGDFCAHGSVRLIGATVGTDFVCDGSQFKFPGEEALYADGITVKGSTFLRGAKTSGLLRFVQASLAQGIFVDGMVFDRGGDCHEWLGPRNASALELEPNVCGLYAPEAVVGSVFFMKRVRSLNGSHRRVWLSVQNARTNTVEDDEASWSAFDRIDLRDCTYQIISGLSGDTAWRLRRIDREYAEPFQDGGHVGFTVQSWWGRRLGRRDQEFDRLCKRFVPQPYIQFADVLRRSGFEGAANGVLSKLERNRTSLGGYGVSAILWRWFLDLVLVYGYSRWRPLAILVACIAVSAVYFKYEHDQHLLRPTRANAYAIEVPATAPALLAKREVRFNAVLYATDTLVPLIDLGQKKNFGFERANLWLIFNSFFGWLLTSLFAAGVSGLVRKN